MEKIPTISGDCYTSEIADEIEGFPFKNQLKQQNYNLQSAKICESRNKGAFRETGDQKQEQDHKCSLKIECIVLEIPEKLELRISFPQTIQQPQIQHNSATNTNNINNFLINNTTNLSDTITTPNFLGDNLNTASEFGTSYTLTAATPTVPTVGTPSTPYFSTPYISTSQLSPSYISTPPYINPAEEADYNSINDSDPKIFDNSGQSSSWFNLFPTSQDSQQISQLGEVTEEDILPSPQSYINITEQLQQLHLQQPQYRQFSCSSTPLILNFDNFSPIIMEMDEAHNPLSKSNTINNNEIHDNDHSLNHNNDNINTSNLNINPTSSEIATTSSSPTLTSKQSATTPIMTQSISTSKTSNNNINNLLNTSFSLIKREESNNNNNIDETTISLTQKILSSASPSTISSNPGGMISTVHNNSRLMVASDGSVGVNTIAATSASDAIRKHENQLDHLTAEQEQQRNKKRPRFNRKFNMQTHRSTHDPNRIKPFACEYSNCGSRFTRKHDLKRHINGIHKGEKVHECSVCRKPFSRKDAWKRHVTTCGKI
ncbi:2628_t:CDS:2 [Entrophospora sp. SA101]|nr:13839_t:CDS:2 [Entrophospora sp. SA101]CAJ0769291.1 2628_t:CDS:2 [Entrophospora sp. SA101]